MWQQEIYLLIKKEIKWLKYKMDKYKVLDKNKHYIKINKYSIKIFKKKHIYKLKLTNFV